MEAINQEIQELFERISVLRKKKLTIGLLNRVYVSNEEDYKDLKVSLEYEEKDSSADQYFLNIEGNLKISYMYNNKNVTINVLYSFYESNETRYNGEQDFSVNTEGEGGELMQNILEEHTDARDWSDLMKYLNRL